MPCFLEKELAESGSWDGWDLGKLLTRETEHKAFPDHSQIFAVIVVFAADRLSDQERRVATMITGSII